MFYHILSLLDEKTYSDEKKLEEIINDQAHNYLVSVILHSYDEFYLVKKNSLRCLNKIMSILCNEETNYNTNNLCKNKTTHLDKNKNEVINNTFSNFNLIIENIIQKLLNNDFIEKLSYHLINAINHTQSSQENIRGGSILLVAIIYTNIINSNNEILIKKVNPSNNIYECAEKLMKDHSSIVKTQTIIALKYINNYIANLISK